MPNTTDFLPIAVGSGSLVTDQTTWAGETNRETGFQNGIVLPQDFNKALRQCSMPAAMVAAFTAAYGASNVPDDGDLSGFLTRYTVALATFIKQTAVTVGATSEGGLVADDSGNLGLSFTNLLADNRSALAASDSLPVRRASDGLTVDATASEVSAYTLSQLLTNMSVPQLSSNTVGGFTVGSNTAVPFNVLTTVPLQPANLPANLATISNGVITIKQEGWYAIVANGAGYVTPNTPSDFASIVFGINKRLASTGGNSGQYSSGLGNQIGSIAAVSLGVVTVQQLFPGDQISLQVTVSTVSGQGSGSGVAGYTNMTLCFFNS